MSARRARKSNELPYIPLGPFQWRIPGVHYRVEYVEFFQGLILGATALSSIPYLTDYLGLPYELAWSCVILEVALYMLHGWLGDPVVPGWITPTLPFTLAFISGFEKGPQRIQAMIAVQLLVAFIFLFMGVTKLADKFVRSVPTSVKGGILLAAPITVIQGQLEEGSQLLTAPVATLAGTLLLAFLSFSPFCEKKRGKIKLLDFGAARDVKNTDGTITVILKQGYAPEEQYCRENNQGPWTDVYAVCATIYKCITGKTPDISLHRLSVDNLKKPSEMGIPVSQEFEQVLTAGLEVHRQNRIQSIDELIRRMEFALEWGNDGYRRTDSRHVVKEALFLRGRSKGVTPLIGRDEVLPAVKRKVFTTTADNQNFLEF